MLSMLGLDYSIVRYLPKASDPGAIINSTLTVSSGVAFILSSVFVAGLNWVSPALAPLRQNVLFVSGVIAAAVLSASTAVLGNIYVARRQASFVFAQSVVFGATKVVLVLLFAFAPHAVGLINAWALALASALVCGLFLLLPRVEHRYQSFRIVIDQKAVAEMTRFAFANYASAILWSAPMLLLPLLVVNLASSEANAYFYVGSSVGGLVAVIPAAVSMSLFAQGAHEERQLIRDAFASAKLSISLLVPAISLVFVFGDKILLLFGKNYSEQATALLWLLAASTIPMTLNLLFFSVRRVQRKMSAVLLSSAWILTVTLVLSVLLLPRVGLLGAGVAWLVAQSSTAAVILAGYLFNR